MTMTREQVWDIVDFSGGLLVFSALVFAFRRLEDSYEISSRWNSWPAFLIFYVLTVVSLGFYTKWRSRARERKRATKASG